MKSNKLLISLLLALLLIAGLQIVYFYPKLPQTVTFHFGLSGKADSWGDKTTFLKLDIIVTTLLTLLFIVMSWLPGKFSAYMIMIPNRDYWLSPENKAQTLQRTSKFILRIGVLTLFCLRLLFHHIYDVNTPGLGQQQKLIYFWPGLLLFMGILAFSIWRHYSYWKKHAVEK